MQTNDAYCRKPTKRANMTAALVSSISTPEAILHRFFYLGFISGNGRHGPSKGYCGFLPCLQRPDSNSNTTEVCIYPGCTGGFL